MDLLSDVLLSVTLKEVNLADFRLTAPWGIHTRGFAPGFCLFVLEGECWVTTAEQSTLKLPREHCIVVPRGGEIRYASSPRAHCSALTEVWDEPEIQALSERPAAFHRVSWGGGGDRCLIFGMAFEATEGAEEQVLRSLPAAFVLQPEAVTARLMRGLSDSLRESTTLRAGESAQRTRFVESVIIGLLRQHIEASEHDGGWIAGLKDPRLMAALQAIHQQYPLPWTLDSLARHCGMSRSGFAERFHQRVGRTPLRYLNDWRVRQACRLLTHTDQSVAEVTSSVGFGNEHALRRNFQRVMGQAPRAYRRAARGADPAGAND